MQKLCLTGSPEADQLLADNPFALLVGMTLDQQIPMEVAFVGPRKIADRLGGIDARTIADPPRERYQNATGMTERCFLSEAIHWTTNRRKKTKCPTKPTASQGSSLWMTSMAHWRMLSIQAIIAL